MSRIQIPGGWFCDDPHRYEDEQGSWVPSLTQVLKLAGLSDYSGADPEDMANAARRGTALHALAEAWNRWQDVDPLWLTSEIEPYFGGYQQFLLDTGFRPSPEWTEKPIIATIAGMRIGMKPDIFGKWGRDDAIIEIKAASSVQACWSIQTGMQEMGIYCSNHVGRARRFALQLLKTGRYKLHPHTDHAIDEAVGVAALRTTWWRLNNGQKLFEALAA